MNFPHQIELLTQRSIVLVAKISVNNIFLFLPPEFDVLSLTMDRKTIQRNIFTKSDFLKKIMEGPKLYKLHYF